MKVCFFKVQLSQSLANKFMLSLKSNYKWKIFSKWALILLSSSYLSFTYDWWIDEINRGFYLNSFPDIGGVSRIKPNNVLTQKQTLETHKELSTSIERRFTLSSSLSSQIDFSVTHLPSPSISQYMSALPV